MTCRDIEGWRAISRLRSFDTTPCFEEGILLPSLLANFLYIYLSVLATLLQGTAREDSQIYTRPQSKIGMYTALPCIRTS
jgi:hypothetical protein